MCCNDRQKYVIMSTKNEHSYVNMRCEIALKHNNNNNNNKILFGLNTSI